MLRPYCGHSTILTLCFSTGMLARGFPLHVGMHGVTMDSLHTWGDAPSIPVLKHGVTMDSPHTWGWIEPNRTSTLLDFQLKLCYTFPYERGDAPYENYFIVFDVTDCVGFRLHT